VYDAVDAAQRAALEAVAVGVRCGDVDEAARTELGERGFGDRFIHSTGHGVGLQIHEEPWVRAGNDDLLRAGDVITIEPGVYLPGRGGVRIEDMVLVTADGPEVLTKSSREFAVT
jgi:Xaa-Pro aminopeptidase